MTAPLRIVVVDDEPLAIERIRMLIARVEGVAIVGTASSGTAALRLTESLQPDAVLLDIVMPGMDGIEVARCLGALPRPPRIVFITAFENFAVAAFDVHAVDYLMKPVDLQCLGRAIERVRNASVGELARSAQSQYLDEFWVSSQAGLTRVSADNIDRITAERDYTRLHAGKRSWLINHSLTKLEQELNPSLFLRMHRGAIIRKAFVIGFQNNEGRWVAQLADGSEQRIGRAYADKAKELRGRGRSVP